MFDDFTLVYLRNPEAHFEVELTVNHGRTKPYDHGDSYGHLAVVVDDLAAEHVRLANEGFVPNPIKEMARDGALMARFFFVQDPDGYKIEVLQKHGRYCCTGVTRSPNDASRSAPRKGGNEMAGNDNANKLDRRQFLAGVSTALIISSRALIHPAEAWALEVKSLKPETMQTLIQMARDIYPHDRLADRFYAVAVKGYDEKAGTRPGTQGHDRGRRCAARRARPKEARRAYADVGWEAERVALLQLIETRPSSRTVRGGLVVSPLQPAGDLADLRLRGRVRRKGGYISRGFDDIDWL